MTRDPALGVGKRLAAQAKPVDPPVDGALDQRRLFQHLEVLRNRRLRGAELPAEFARAPAPAPRKRVNDRAAGAVGERMKCAIERRDGLHSQMAIYLPGLGCKPVGCTQRKVIHGKLRLAESQPTLSHCGEHRATSTRSSAAKRPIQDAGRPRMSPALDADEGDEPRRGEDQQGVEVEAGV